jgi:predicted lactoylglutathione lyase
MYEQIEQQLKEQETAKNTAPGTTEQKPVETPVENKPVEEQKPAEQTPQNVEVTPQKIEVPEDDQNGEEIPWYEKEEAAASETKTEVKPKVEESVEEDEDIKLLREFKKSGKTLRDFVKELDVPDFATMDEASIVEIGLKELEGFTGDDYAAAVEEFNQMSLFQKKKLVSDYRNTLIAQNEEKLKQLTSAPAKQKQEVQQTLTRFEAEIGSIAKDMSGKEVYGLKVTDEMSTKIQSYLTKEISLNRKDGSIDADLLAEFALWKLYGKDIVRTNVTKAKNSGRREVLEATTNPSSGRGPSNNNNGFQGVTVDDAFGSYLNAKKR